MRRMWTCDVKIRGCEDEMWRGNVKIRCDDEKILQTPQYGKNPALRCSREERLDDEWPESVEQQGLLLLVWRRNFRNDDERCVIGSRKEKYQDQIVRSFYTQWLLHRHFYTGNFYPQKLLLYTQIRLHTDTFTHRPFYTQELFLHTNACTHRRFYTQTLLHTDAFTRALLHIDTFTHRLLHTDLFTHRGCFQTLWHGHFLHTDMFTHRHFFTRRPLTRQELFSDAFTRTLLHTDMLTHRDFCTQTLLHTDALTHRRFDTQTLLHTETFTHRRFLHTGAFTHRQERHK